MITNFGDYKSRFLKKGGETDVINACRNVVFILKKKKLKATSFKKRTVFECLKSRKDMCVVRLPKLQRTTNIGKLLRNIFNFSFASQRVLVYQTISKELILGISKQDIKSYSFKNEKVRKYKIDQFQTTHQILLIGITSRTTNNKLFFNTLNYFAEKKLWNLSIFSIEHRIHLSDLREYILFKQKRNKVKKRKHPITVKNIAKRIRKDFKICKSHKYSERIIVQNKAFINQEFQKAKEENETLLNSFPDERMMNCITSRLKFVLLYKGNEETTRESIIRIISEEIESFKNKTLRKNNSKSRIEIEYSEEITERHKEIKERTYPYHWKGNMNTIFNLYICQSSSNKKNEVIEEEQEGEEEEEEEEKILVAYIMLQEVNYVWDVSVDPHFYHQGFAQILFHKACHYILEKNMKDIVLDVRESNLPAVELYKKRLGFKIVGDKFPSYYDWHGGISMIASCNEILQATKWCENLM